ncbi:MAG TPA: hypothetical protein VE957_22380 [Terriglobales bacterium]|nr:hypothetical protein [Terriglobales bacterium]
MKRIEQVDYALGGLCLVLFVAAQTFQQVAFLYWLPVPHGPKDDFLTYLLPIDQFRAILIMGTIVLLIVPFVVIALRCFKAAPIASVLGLVFGAIFICFEISYRSMDFFVVGGKWASQFTHAHSEVERQDLLQRFAFWSELVEGWYFPLMLSYFLSSCSFAASTWKRRGRSGWHYLAPIAFVLNAFRLMGRMLSNYAGQRWLDGFNGRLYFPAVLTINALLILWFFLLATRTAEENGIN